MSARENADQVVILCLYWGHGVERKVSKAQLSPEPFSTGNVSKQPQTAIVLT
jgi:hypothetical protein